MQIVLSQIAILLCVLVLMLAGPLLGVAALRWHRRRVRQARRSPLTAHLLRSPGHSLREQIDDAHLDATAELSVLMIGPLLLATLFLAQYAFGFYSKASHLIVMFSLMTLGFLFFSGRRLLRHVRLLDRLRTGHDAELAVGQELDQLMRQGAVVFHDLAGDHFNIDHVVVSTAGLFAIETKGYAKPIRGRGTEDAKVDYDGKRLAFPHFSTDKPIAQCERQAKWLQSMLAKATGDAGLVATPVLALPGWFVNRTGRGAVRVYSGRELPKLLGARAIKPLSREQVQRIAYQLEQRCRDVKPSDDRHRVSPAHAGVQGTRSMAAR